MVEPEGPSTVKPLHVFLAGAAALGSGALLTAAASYKRAEKQLAAEGIDPRVRSVILPHAVRALLASLAVTGCVGAAGFYALTASGMLATQQAPLPSLGDAQQLLTGLARGGQGQGSSSTGQPPVHPAQQEPQQQRSQRS